uniref:Novel immune-type receptor 9 n=1 Tax=Oryzias latipes TaxID=8090 RepID=H2N264_ORYLA
MQLRVILCGLCEYISCFSRLQFKHETISLIFSSSVHLSAVIWAGAVKQDTGVRSVSVGENVTLQCFYENVMAMHFSWYQQPLGGRPELLSFFYKYDDPSKVDHWLQKKPRFSLQREEGINHLHISDVQLSDSATYFCGSSHSNMVEFGDGLFLSVEEKSPTEIIIQEPTSETIQPGGSITFSCTVHSGNCGEAQTVCWFRRGSQPGVLHTQRKDCRPVAAPGPPSQSCTYSLQKKDLNSSDAGTYFCAVASCGKMLLGSGTKLIMTNQTEGQAAQIKVLVQLSVIRTGVLLLFILSCVLFVRKSDASP